jgi:hypothetical protein
VFLNLVLDEMTQHGDMPHGMATVLSTIRSIH